jgi:iron complex outermembrane receptor protein
MYLNERNGLLISREVFVRRISTHIHCSSTAFLVAAAFWCSGAQAQMLVHFDLPAQSLARSLTAIGTATNTGIGFSASQVAGLIAPSLKADLTVDGALSRVLAGTGLRPEHLDDYTIVIAAIESSTPDAAQKKSESTTALHVMNVAEDVSNLKRAEVEPPVQDDSESNPKTEDRRREELAEVLVTGTHIGGAAPVGAPILTLDSTYIENSGYISTQELIQSIPQNFRGGAAGASTDQLLSSGTNASYNSSFGSGINLRGLGSTATLVLVNGHRVASSGSGYFTDISTIPISAIDHIDVLTDGASAIYGSEAIAGVVNIVLKKQTDGLEVGARYGAAHGFSTDGGNGQIGHEWTGGGFTFGGDFSHGSSLDVSERPFTSAVGSPTSIFPSFTQTALSAATHQNVGDQLEVHGDAQYSHASKQSYSSGTSAPQTYRLNSTTDRWSASVGASFRLSDSWTLRYDASGGNELNNPPSYSITAGQAAFYDDSRTQSRFSDQDLSASGDLFRLPAGAIKAAVGASYRTEEFNLDNITPFGSTPYEVSRNVKAVYAETNIPVFGEPNQITGFRKLTLSVAVRHDHYSDFGNTTNPRYGVVWSPVESLNVRGAYSTSFRAPATGQELLYSKIGILGSFLQPFPGPDNVGSVPVLELLGGRPNLQPETARNTTVGFDFKPNFIPDLQLSFNYYNIVYSKQLASAPNSYNPVNDPSVASIVTRFPSSAPILALVSASEAAGAPYYDLTGGAFGPNPLASTVYLYDGREANLASTRTSGYDISANYHAQVGLDSIDSRFDLTHIDQFETQLTAGASEISTVGTVGYPASLRFRGQSVWTHRDLNVSVAGNYVGRYTDTSALRPREVGSYTTFDFVTRYNVGNTATPVLHGLVGTLAVSNLFDRRPPFVENGTLGLFSGSHYDPANSDPTGRLITVTLSKRW